MTLPSLDAQIQQGFTFIEGNAVLGKIEGGPFEYDGKYDIKSSHYQEEYVKDHEPSRTFFDIYVSNIETDTDRMYEMKITAYHLNTEDPSLEGVSQIVIFDEDGNKSVIGQKAY
jgi:hypothetical protein